MFIHALGMLLVFWVYCCYQETNALLLLQQPASSLSSPSSCRFRRCLSSSPSSSNVVLFSSRQQDDDFLSNESPKERAARLKLVQQIQKIYDKDVSPPFVEATSDDSLLLMSEVPLFHAEWSELIGFQKVLDIDEPHFKQMFRETIKHNKQPWRFGHVHIPNGSNNGSNKYPNDEPTGMVGTLMQITDFFDGGGNDDHLELIVQAIERFEIVNVTQQQNEPYSLATIRLLPDHEIIGDNDKSDNNNGITSELETWFEWEYYPTKYTDCNDGGDDRSGQQGGRRVTPLINYNSKFFADEISIGGGGGGVGSSTERRGVSKELSVAELEYKVWVALDELLTVLEQATGGTMRIPIPSQLLGLLPIDLSWPDNFRLDSIAQQLQARNANIGTYTQSPFVRVAENINYPSLRRARRFSYVIWILLDSILDLFGPQSVTNKQGLLECRSISERLSAAYEQLDQINRILKR